MPRIRKYGATQTEATKEHPLKQQTSPDRHADGQYSVNHKEDQMLAAIDLRRHAGKFVEIFDRLSKGTTDVQQTIQEIAPTMLMQMVKQAILDGNPKVQLEASKLLLGMAGFSTVNKHMVGTVSADQSKEALLALIAGSTKQLQSDDIEIVDDRDSEDVKAND